MRPPHVWFFTDGLRHVKPYVYDFKTNAKGRWYGRSLVEVFASEFTTHPREYYERTVSQGRITINGARVETGYLIRGGDRIAHTTHRHEPPVRGTEAIEIVADTEELLVVNKPSTVPMHPCGAYRYNSLFHILDSVRREEQASVSVETLHIVHRLDRLTSGLTIFAKTPDAARRFGDDLKGGRTQKTYLARVSGDFGSSPSSSSMESCVFPVSAGWERSADVLKASQGAVGWARVLLRGSTSHGAEPGEDGGGRGVDPTSPWVRVQHPIECVSPIAGIYRCAFDDHPHPTTFTTTADHAATTPFQDSASVVAASGAVGSSSGGAGIAAKKKGAQCEKEAKEAVTLVRKLSFNGATSLVEVAPQHGRTHQIRLHLQWLGHPIANDPCYGGTLHYGSHGIAHEKALLHKDVEATNDEGQPPSSLLPSLATSAGTLSASAQGEDGGGDGVVGAVDGVGGGADDWYMCPRRACESQEQFMVRTCRFCHDALEERKLGTAAPVADAGAEKGVAGEKKANASSMSAEGKAFGEEHLHCAGIWLHALRYARHCHQTSEQNWRFETSLPEWARAGFLEAP